MVNVYIFCETNLWPFTADKDFPFENSLFGAGILVKNPDPDKNKHSGYSTGFDARESFCIGFDKNLVTSGADMTSSVHVDHKKRYLKSW